MNIIRRFEVTRPFTDAEAWMLFRFAAFGEAIGWTLLITGIVLERVTGNHGYVAAAGQIHGMLFFAYLVAAIVLYPSLGWPRWKALLGLACSVPPYGSLVFERYIAYTRRAHGFKSYKNYLLYTAFASRY